MNERELVVTGLSSSGANKNTIITLKRHPSQVVNRAQVQTLFFVMC
jgi:hypothetical protein